MIAIEDVRGLGTQYWNRWMAGLVLALVALVGLTVAVDPSNAWLVVLLGALGVLHAGFATTELALGHRVQAVAFLVMTGGWAVVATAAAVDAFDPWMWYGFAVNVLGSLVAILDDHGHRLRAAIGS